MSTVLAALLLCALPLRAQDSALSQRIRAYEREVDAFRQELIRQDFAVRSDPRSAFQAQAGEDDPLAALEDRQTELQRRGRSLSEEKPDAEGRRDLDRSLWSVERAGTRSIPALRAMRDFVGRHARLFRDLSETDARLAELEEEVRSRLGEGDASRLDEEERLGFAQRLSALDARGRRTWAAYQALAREADSWERKPSPETRTYRDQARQVANPAALSLAGLRDRMLALRATLQLSPESRRGGFSGTGLRPEDRARVQAFSDLPSLARGPETAALNGPLGWALKDGLDLVSSSIAPPARRPDDQESRFVRRTRLRRYAGELETAGNPVGLSGYSHRQTGGTCAVCAQGQVLRAANLFPEESPRAVEDALYDRAVERGWFGSPDGPVDRERDGTPPSHLGSLLTEYGVPYVKRDRFDPRAFDEAVRAGRLVIAGVHGDTLWGRANPGRHRAVEEPNPDRVDHVVLVVGAGVDSAAGTTELYYVNDSATGEGARPVPRHLLLEAMQRSGGVHLEIP